MVADLRSEINIGPSLKSIPRYFSHPVQTIKEYDRSFLRPDIIAGLTVAVILLPQAIAFALIAELPPAMGIYTAIIAAVVGALWGSSNQAHTGPTNAMSLLVLSILLGSFAPGTSEFIAAAGLLAIMAGVFQLILGVFRLGMLVNFVSHSVVVGFAAGAGVLIAVRQIPPLLGLESEGHNLLSSVQGIVQNIDEINITTAALGFGALVLVVILQRINRKIPAALIAMVLASALVYFLNLTEEGVAVIGELPKNLPPLADLPLLDLDFVTSLSTGALAVGAIGLVETTAISRSIATHTGQRLDSNQEFVGQGLANIAVGFFSGYPGAGSFSRSAVNFNSGARSAMAAISSSVFVLIALFAFAPMAAYLPRSALAGVLIVVAVGMVDRAEISRIWQGALGDAVIMLVTLLGTLFLDIATAILVGITLSFVRYLLRTSMPRVNQVVPEEDFDNLSYQPDRPNCPQLSIIDILGDLYFGAVNHVEDAIHEQLEKEEGQRYLLINMDNVNQCDFSGIHMLESVVRTYRERGGDVYMMKVGYRVDKVIHSTGFDDSLGESHFLPENQAISYLFYRVLDPAVCIYECPHRVFAECQNLPKQLHTIHVEAASIEDEAVVQIEPAALWNQLRTDPEDLTIIDVREPREYRQGHIPGAVLIPLPKILTGDYKIDVADKQKVVFVCRSGRRSRRAAREVAGLYGDVAIVRGGTLAWEAADLLEAIEQTSQYNSDVRSQ
jgi:SulP family sulfate permease